MIEKAVESVSVPFPFVSHVTYDTNTAVSNILLKKILEPSPFFRLMRVRA